MNDALHLYSTRLEQLNRQEKIDSRLRNLRCTDEILKYFFNQREQNRKLTKEYEDTPFYSIFSKISEQLEITNKELLRIEKILEEGYACSEINK